MNLPLIAAFCLTLLAGCSHPPETVSAARYHAVDDLFRTLETNVRNHHRWEIVADIDHSRLANEAGSPMPPARVLIWSDPELETAILRRAPLAAIDLPLRVLAYEKPDQRSAAVIANSYDYLANRHALPDDPQLRGRYESAVDDAMRSIPESFIARFASDTMPDDGLVTLDSPYDFATTERRIRGAIDAQSDTVNFGTVDFAARAKAQGLSMEPMLLILFGGPGPGGRAMASAPTLGLDAFCQKLLLWQDAQGGVHVTFNDLSAMARRQQVPAGIALRTINARLRKTFEEALRD